MGGWRRGRFQLSHSLTHCLTPRTCGFTPVSRPAPAEAFKGRNQETGHGLMLWCFGAVLGLEPGSHCSPGPHPGLPSSPATSCATETRGRTRGRVRPIRARRFRSCGPSADGCPLPPQRTTFTPGRGQGRAAEAPHPDTPHPQDISPLTQTHFDSTFFIMPIKVLCAGAGKVGQ